jgi:hypothetical protein
MRRAAADPTVELPVEATAELPVDQAVATSAPHRRRHRAAVLVAAATVGVLGLTGGLAAAGRLPHAAQDRVADVAQVVGIDLPNHDDARDVGPGNGRENLRLPTPNPGANDISPPVGPQGPGATGTLPGSSGSAPGHSPIGPGSSEDAPGHTQGTTGDTATTSPGSSANPPGRSGEEPGGSGNAPGHQTDDGDPGSTPGSSGSAPGQNKTSSGDVPGKSGDAPGRNNDTAGSSSVQGTDQ